MLRRAHRYFSSSPAALAHRVLVVGGNGALGKSVVGVFKGLSWETVSADVTINLDASKSVLLPTNATWKDQAEVLKTELAKQGITADGLDAVVCAAGGWTGRSAALPGFVTSARGCHVNASPLCLWLQEARLATTRCSMP
jgi:hypothetical protein